MDYSRGDVVLVNLGQVEGSEEKGEGRPCVIVQTNIGIEYSPTVIVVPLTDAKGKKIYPFQALISRAKDGVKVDSIAKCEQIRTIDKRRIVKKVAHVSEETIKCIDNGIKNVLELP